MISKYKVAWLLSYLSIASASAAIITPALPAIQLQFNLGPGTVDWMVSAFLIGYVIGQLIYGPLANRWGRVFALRTGLIINLIGVMVCLIGIGTHAYWLLVMGRTLSALGAASGLACTFMLINEWLPEPQRKSAIAYSILSFTLGIGLAVTLGGLITDYWQWSSCFVVLFIHGLIMLFGTHMFHETLQQPRAINVSAILHSYKHALSSSILVTFSLAVGFSSVIAYCFSAAAPQIANELLHISPAQYGYWNLLNVLGMLGGGLWSKNLLNQFSALKVVTLGIFVCALGITSLLIMWKFEAASVLWFFGSTAVLYLFSGLIFSGSSYIASNALTDKASGSSMMSFINMSTATLAVVVMSWLSKNTLLAFSGILAGMWFLVTGLLIINQSQPPEH